MFVLSLLALSLSAAGQVAVTTYHNDTIAAASITKKPF
jgi:hypothetical protein